MHTFRYVPAAAMLQAAGEATPPLSGVTGQPRQDRYGGDARLAVTRMLGVLDPALAALVTAIIAVRGECRGSDQRGIDRDALAAALAIDRDELLPHIRRLDQRAYAAISLTLFDPEWTRGSEHAALPVVQRHANAAGDGGDPASGAAPGDAGPPACSEILLATGFAAMLDRPHPPTVPGDPAPVLDEDGTRDLAVVITLARSGRGGHLALRRRRHAPREVADLAALLDAAGLPLLVVDASAEDLPVALLRAELHAGTAPSIVLIADDRLTTAADSATYVDDDDEDMPATGELGAREPVPPTILTAMGSLVLWSVPADGDMPQAELSWLAGCLGPLRHDPAWARGVIAAAIGPGIGDPAASAGVRALARRLADPRDGTAIAAAATALAAGARPASTRRQYGSPPPSPPGPSHPASRLGISTSACWSARPMPCACSNVPTGRWSAAPACSPTVRLAAARASTSASWRCAWRGVGRCGR